MSLLTKLFGGKSSSEKAPSPQEAIQKLLEIEDLLRKRQDVLEKKIEDELTVAKTNGVKNKRRMRILCFGSQATITHETLLLYRRISFLLFLLMIIMKSGT